MFSGIITDLGELRSVAPGGDARFVIATRYPTAEIALGASIACSGCCLTVTDKGGDWFAATVSAETRRVTTLGVWMPGRRINLERALRLGDEFGGHIVLGHVDGVARLIERRPEGGSERLLLAAPAEVAALIASKGSVALDGVSLTVNEVRGAEFAVNIIPHTQRVTTLGSLRPGDSLNLEIDVIARYLARQLEYRGATR